MRITALAGGVGGAKLAQGLAQALPPSDLTIIVNTADDFQHLGLRISPDLDTVCYTLAGMANRKTGWGRAGETWSALQSLEMLGGPTWFRLGDKDLATHLERTRRINLGQPLSEVVAEFCRAWGVRETVLPMTDDPVATVLHSSEGDLEFQDYFVRHKCQPRVQGLEFRGIESAHPAPGVLEALAAADGIIICPSNPWVSIRPILAVPGVSDALRSRQAIAVSPIVAGRALRGPADKMYLEMGMEPSALTVANQYKDTVGAFVLDEVDTGLREAVEQLGLRTLVCNTIMRTVADRRRLAADVLDFMGALWK